MSGFIEAGKLPFKTIIIGLGVTLVVILLLSLILCAILTFGISIPYPIMPYVLLIADAIGVFTGAYIAAAINKSQGFLLGIIIGFLSFVIVFVVGLSSGETISILTGLRLFVLLLFGFFGGIKGVNKKERIHIK